MGRIGCEGRYLVGSSLEQADVGLDPGRFSAEENLRAYSRNVHSAHAHGRTCSGDWEPSLQAEIVELCAFDLSENLIASCM